MTSVQFHRDNHFVPCVYLNGWAGPDGKIAAYRVLVPHDKFPIWRRYSPSALTYHSHLYTQTTSGVEKDDIETWLDQDFERPAEEPLKKARTGARMSRDDWKQLIRFVAAQDVRNPAYYWEQAKRVDEQFPDLMQSTIETAIKEREQSAKTGKPAKLKSLLRSIDRYRDGCGDWARATIENSKKSWVVSIVGDVSNVTFQ